MTQSRTHGPTHELLPAAGQNITTDVKGNVTLLPLNLTPQSSPLYRYVYASYIDEPVVRKAAGTGGTIHYYHRNQQYSITAMTTSTGAVAERYAYTAYGQPTIAIASGSVLTSSAVGNRYSYTGREWDETLGLHHFRARWMSLLAGRFLGMDPIQEFREEFMLLLDESWLSKVLANVYEFSESSTFNYTDEHGLYPQPPFGCTNGVTTSRTGSGRMKCYEYYPDNLASNGLQEKCLCWTANQDPEYPNVAMGCTWLPYTIFTPACDVHDTCWGTCGETANWPFSKNPR